MNQRRKHRNHCNLTRTDTGFDIGFRVESFANRSRFKSHDLSLDLSLEIWMRW